MSKNHINNIDSINKSDQLINSLMDISREEFSKKFYDLYQERLEEKVWGIYNSLQEDELV